MKDKEEDMVKQQTPLTLKKEIIGMDFKLQ